MRRLRLLGHILEFSGLLLGLVGWLLLPPLLSAMWHPELDLDRIWSVVAAVPGALLFYVGYLLLHRD